MEWQRAALKATTLRGLVLYGILQKSHELHPSTTTAQWVDDLAQRTQSPPSGELVRDLQEDMLAVASKSQVIATTPSIAKQVVSTLARHDKDIQEASQAKDLGSWVCPAQESQCVEPWPSDGPRR